jgi:hypothetical protein
LAWFSQTFSQARSSGWRLSSGVEFMNFNDWIYAISALVLPIVGIIFTFGLAKMEREEVDALIKEGQEFEKKLASEDL